MDTREAAQPHHVWRRGEQGEVGIFLHGYDALWLPASLLQEDRQQSLADALFAASRHQMVRRRQIAGDDPNQRALDALGFLREDQVISDGSRYSRIIQYTCVTED